jgi:hypothetical protein
MALHLSATKADVSNSRNLPNPFIERLLPHAFVWEKVAKPDEGAFDYKKDFSENAFFDAFWMCCYSFRLAATMKRPLIRLWHLRPR